MKGNMKDRLSYFCHQTGSTTAPAAISRRQEWKGHKEPFPIRDLTPPHPVAFCAKAKCNLC